MQIIYSFTEYQNINRPLGYERVYLPLFNVAETPFHIQGDHIIYILKKTFNRWSQLFHFSIYIISTLSTTF